LTFTLGGEQISAPLGNSSVQSLSDRTKASGKCSIILVHCYVR